MQKALVFVIHPERDDNVLKRLVYEYHDQIFGRTTLQISFVSSKEASQLGRDFGDIIKSKIDSSHYVITIVTPNSERSVWVNQEIGYAEGVKKTILPMKLDSMAHQGLGFIHSNIDAQLFHYRQRRFRKLDKFFEEKFGKKVAKVLKRPLTTKPIKESKEVSARRIEPDVV